MLLHAYNRFIKGLQCFKLAGRSLIEELGECNANDWSKLVMGRIASIEANLKANQATT